MKTVAVIFGGRSTEHDVSIVTAISSVIKPLELSKEYQVEAVYIARDGAWYWDPRLKDIALFSSGKIEDFIKRSKPVSIEFNGGLTLVRPGGLSGRKVQKIDIAFPAMHGTYGEDGALTGLLEMSGVAYVGCGVAASAVAMDKLLAKQQAIANNIPTSKFLGFSKADLEHDTPAIVQDIKAQLTFPLFVKPTHLGSSIGISRATTDIELRNALEVAAHYDDMVIVEEAVPNLIEVTLPIIGPTADPTPALLEQPLLQSEDFFDFETKYMQGSKKGKGGKSGAKGAQGYSQIPAKLPEELYAEAQATGIAVYKALGCDGIARVDMLIDSMAGAVYFNEVNPLPGGLYAHNWKQAGVSSIELVKKLIGFAEARHANTNQLTTSFDTNYLKQF